MYLPASRYRPGSAAPDASASERSVADQRAALVKCAVLLDIGVATASVVAFGVWDLITSRGGPWLAVLAIAAGGTASCMLWRRAGRMIDRDERRLDAAAEHDSVVADVERRALTHPFGR